ncbi:hypothetical protein P7K49_040265 [Saguinus oedipus]|uniref:Phosphatidylserine synthase n=1 Tax=Saguinus oedipus TaxID=9490 RepID=A0ABQ9T8W4_SAGOE|nr:hypothetical protein P7K49_040265 [Saguinus oedipus]
MPGGSCHTCCLTRTSLGGRAAQTGRCPPPRLTELHGVATICLTWPPLTSPTVVGTASQTVQDGRQFLKYVDPKLGVPLPERDYGGNCLIYDPDNKTDPFHNVWVRLQEPEAGPSPGAALSHTRHAHALASPHMPLDPYTGSAAGPETCPGPIPVGGARGQGAPARWAARAWSPQHLSPWPGARGLAGAAQVWADLEWG